MLLPVSVLPCQDTHYCKTLSQQQQTISMRSNVRERTHVLLTNTPLSHLHGFRASGARSGLATKVTLTRVARRLDSITRGRICFCFDFCTAVGDRCCVVSNGTARILTCRRQVSPSLKTTELYLRSSFRHRAWRKVSGGCYAASTLPPTPNPQEAWWAQDMISTLAAKGPEAPDAERAESRVKHLIIIIRAIY
jgi:hypothetical protein